jgi:autotransporter passenger strand-loop-strand repeat protein
MTTYTVPPDKADLVLDRGDVLNVDLGGTATGTTIGVGGVAFVNGGTTIDTTIKALGVENVGGGGVADDTTIKRGGVENVASGSTDNHAILDGGALNVRGSSNGVIINDGSEFVNGGGTSNDTIINRFGVEYVHGGVANNTTINGGLEDVVRGGVADNVIFAGSRSRLDLSYPTGLTGTITHWRVGDVIHFSDKIHVTSVHENADDSAVTVNYFDSDFGTQTVTYSLVGQQANTQIELQRDGHGGADLVLVSVTGIQAHHHHEIV